MTRIYITPENIHLAKQTLPTMLKNHSSCKRTMVISNSFSDSVSPAFLIRVGAAMEYSGSGEEEEEGKVLIFNLARFFIFYF